MGVHVLLQKADIPVHKPGTCQVADRVAVSYSCSLKCLVDLGVSEILGFV